MRFTVDPETFTVAPEHGAPRSWFEPEGFDLLSRWWLLASWQRRYSYQFRWLGRPVIQLPTDVLMMQDLLHRVRPSLVIETGVAHGGSAVLHASVLEMVHRGASLPADRPHVIAIDIEIRPENRAALDTHAFADRISLIEGDSIDASVVEDVRARITEDDVVLVVLDSCHARGHVAAELDAYAPLVTPGSALVVMDGVMPELASLPGGDPSWTDDHPGAAVEAFLRSEPGRRFAIDDSYDGMALTHSPGGVLLRSAE